MVCSSSPVNILPLSLSLSPPPLPLSVVSPWNLACSFSRVAQEAVTGTSLHFGQKNTWPRMRWEIAQCISTNISSWHCQELFPPPFLLFPEQQRTIWSQEPPCQGSHDGLGVFCEAWKTESEGRILGVFVQPEKPG